MVILVVALVLAVVSMPGCASPPNLKAASGELGKLTGDIASSTNTTVSSATDTKAKTAQTVSEAKDLVGASPEGFKPRLVSHVTTAKSADTSAGKTLSAAEAAVQAVKKANAKCVSLQAELQDADAYIQTLKDKAGNAVTYERAIEIGGLGLGLVVILILWLVPLPLYLSWLTPFKTPIVLTMVACEGAGVIGFLMVLFAKPLIIGGCVALAIALITLGIYAYEHYVRVNGAPKTPSAG